MTKDDQQWLATLGIELTENEAYSLVFIRKNEKITNGDYQKINNVNRDKNYIPKKPRSKNQEYRIIQIGEKLLN